LAAQRGGEDALRLGGRQRGGVREQVAVVARASARLDEGATPRLEGPQELRVGLDLEVSALGEESEVLGPALAVEVEERVRAEGRHDALAPAASRELGVVLEARARGVGGREDLEL